MPSPAADDYLKTVYQHTEWQDEPLTPSGLAQRLGVAPSSVTEMVKKLAASGLINHVPYGPLRLSEAGDRRALAIIRRHRLVETWLVQEMGYRWDEVHDEAEVLEHTLSDRLLNKIDERLGRPQFDPHGDRIPSADGEMARPAYVLAANAPEGHRGRILRVQDRDPELLRLIDAAGLAVGAEVTLRDGVFWVGETCASLPDGACEAIWLTA